MSTSSRKYAEGTTVPISQSRAEIERTLERYHATGFMYGQQGDTAMIAFLMKGRQYRIMLNYPKLEKFRYVRGARRSDTAMKAVYDQETRRLWRGLAMIIKAKLEAVESGISTVEEEFFANTVLPNNQTMQEWAEPQITEVYQSGRMPSLLPGATPQKMIESSQVMEGEVM